MFFILPLLLAHLVSSFHVLFATIFPSFLHVSGHEEDDYRMLTSTEEGGSPELNNSGLYSTVCVELMVDGLAVTTVLQASHVNDYEGASGTSISFDYAPQVCDHVTHITGYKIYVLHVDC